MPASIFNGNFVKTLRDQLRLGDTTEIRSGTVDPSAGAGVVAPVGSSYHRTTDGSLWMKTAAGDTAWTALGTGGSALEIEDEAASVDAAVTKINFTGGSVTATTGGAGIVNVDIPSGISFPAPINFMMGGLLTIPADFLDSAASVSQSRTLTRVYLQSPVTGASGTSTIRINKAASSNPGVVTGFEDITLTHTGGAASTTDTSVSLTLAAGDYVWPEATAVGVGGFEDLGITLFFGSEAILQQAETTFVPPPLGFRLHGLVNTPLVRFGAATTINGPREVTALQIHAFESGSSGSTTVRIHRSAFGPSGPASADVVLTANGGEAIAKVGASLTGVAGDIFYAELVSVATGGVEDLSVECFFGSEGLMSSLTVAGRTITDLANLKVLWSAPNAGQFGFVLDDSFGVTETAYQMPANKSLTIVAAKMVTANVSTGQLYTIGYGTAAALKSQAGAPTGATYAYGLDGSTGNNFDNIFTVAATTAATIPVLEWALNIKIPSDATGFFPFVRNGSGASSGILIYGLLGD